jgi:hypothetical protein
MNYSHYNYQYPKITEFLLLLLLCFFKQLAIKILLIRKLANAQNIISFNTNIFKTVNIIRIKL